MFNFHSPGFEASPPYNMGLAGSRVKTNFNTDRRSRVARGVTPDFLCLGVAVDKLRLCAIVKGEAKDMPNTIQGLNASKIGRGRRLGIHQVIKCQGWTKPPKQPGGIYWEFRQPDVGNWRELHAVFNPAKMCDQDWELVSSSYQAYGIHDFSRLYVEEYHGCIDYMAPRELLLMDDRNRKMDLVNVGRKGPETERTGYLSKSDLRAQLYDKTRERRAAGEEDGRAKHVTRFELMVRKPGPLGDGASLFDRPPSDSLFLGDLPYVTYPGKNITVRCMGYDPLRVADHVYGSLAAYARGLGLRAAIGYAKTVFRYDTRRVQQVLDTMMPELQFAPRDMWRERWHSAVQDVLHRMSHAWLAAR